MNLETEPYLAQAARWPSSGRHILAQFDDESIVVYQAYRPSIGRHAAEQGYFGGDFKLTGGFWSFTRNPDLPESEIFLDGFETGDFSKWSSAVP